VADFLIDQWGWWPVLAHIVVAIIKIALLIQIPAVGALVFIWAERKVSGRIQDRLGPTRVGGAFGWLQSLADGIKLIAKEDVTPSDADALLFRLAPYVGFAAAFSALMAVPFSSHFVAVEVNAAVFFILAVLGLEVFGVILAGYASGSKWSLFGAMREAAQVVSYEVPLGLCVVVPELICGTMNLIAIGDMQKFGMHSWLIFHDPFTFGVFWVYFVCAVASVNRAPFDLAEAESELVAGFHTEYSGLRWSFFFMAEYGSMFTVSLLAAILFFGGWNGPFPLPFLNYDNYFLLGLLGDVLGVNILLAKASIGMIVMIWVRWTLPRLRIDQVITTCLKYCVPLAAICFVGVLLIKVNFLGLFGLMSLDNWVAIPRAEIREGWASRQLASREAVAVASATPAAEVGPAETPASTETPSATEVDTATLPATESPPATDEAAPGTAEVGAVNDETKSASLAQGGAE
jgi:NADH-quinone oxidoreductase subunit H